MTLRFWRYVLVTLVTLALIAALGYWYWNRPAPEPSLERLAPADGAAITRVTPGTAPRAHVVVAVTDEQTLSDAQLLTLSYHQFRGMLRKYQLLEGDDNNGNMDND